MWTADVAALVRRLGFCLLFPAVCLAQTDTAAAARDSITPVKPIILPDTSVPGTPALRQSKSPWLAVGLSAVAPGAGQIYTENYWKAPVIWALGGYWIYEWVKQNDKYREFRDLYNGSITGIEPNGNTRYKELRDFYRDDRDRFAWFLGGLYFLNLLDAYVDAHLYDFDVSPDLSADGRLVPRVTATVRLTF